MAIRRCRIEDTKSDYAWRSSVHSRPSRRSTVFPTSRRLACRLSLGPAERSLGCVAAHHHRSDGGREGQGQEAGSRRPRWWRNGRNGWHGRHDMASAPSRSLGRTVRELGRPSHALGRTVRILGRTVRILGETFCNLGRGGAQWEIATPQEGGLLLATTIASLPSTPTGALHATSSKLSYPRARGRVRTPLSRNNPALQNDTGTLGEVPGRSGIRGRPAARLRA